LQRNWAPRWFGRTHAGPNPSQFPQVSWWARLLSVYLHHGIVLELKIPETFGSSIIKKIIFPTNEILPMINLVYSLFSDELVFVNNHPCLGNLMHLVIAICEMIKDEGNSCNNCHDLWEFFFQNKNFVLKSSFLRFVFILYRSVELPRTPAAPVAAASLTAVLPPV
jgi:hypothetical protein